ncbi:hypothetical protein [Halocynthiibacter styelae]|uniref:Uncharacterized protein n=1 Tax=Halocynthiibacter styelae TaxID=2761955 RepID=A0A8J7IEM0_9RHOB|nr:hypothetical protein [Paenihalocynthiibacter styelae]MBI1494954.1 hypothetical protein [Paenihalocynthiibacter styelae]
MGALPPHLTESAKDATEWQGTLVTLVWNTARQTITVEDNFAAIPD